MSTTPPVPAVDIEDIVKKVMENLQPKLDELASGDNDVDTDAIVADVQKRVLGEVNKVITDSFKEHNKTLTSLSKVIETVRERVNNAFEEIREIGGARIDPVPPAPRSIPEPVPTPRKSGPFLPTLLDDED